MLAGRRADRWALAGLAALALLARRDLLLAPPTNFIDTLPLPEGRHRVRYWYDPLSVRLGLLVSGLSLSGVLALVVRGRLRAPEHGVQFAERIK